MSNLLKCVKRAALHLSIICFLFFCGCTSSEYQVAADIGRESAEINTPASEPPQDDNITPVAMEPVDTVLWNSVFKGEADPDHDQNNESIEISTSGKDDGDFTIKVSISSNELLYSIDSTNPLNNFIRCDPVRIGDGKQALLEIT